MPLLDVMLDAPNGGVFMRANPRKIPRQGAARLENFRVDLGLARSRGGSTALLDDFDAKRVVDMFNLQFNDGSVETLRHTKDTTQRASGAAWAAVTLDAAWTGTDADRFWALVVPWGSETKGRIITGNGVDTMKSWAGLSGTMNAVANGATFTAARAAIMGDDNRLILGATTEGGNFLAQQVRWSVVALANGDATDWTDDEAGNVLLRGDDWPITGFWKQGSTIFVGKSRSICYLVPSGVYYDAYGYETIHTEGDGLYVPRSLVQHGDSVFFLSHRDVILFRNGTITNVGGPVRYGLFRRLNHAALDQVTAIVDARNNRIGWGLPLDGAKTPTEIWWLFPETGKWEPDKRPHTALSRYNNIDITTIDELAGTINALAGTIDSLSASSTPESSVVYGTSTGKTRVFDESAKDDAGEPITCAIDTAALVPVGERLTIAGREHLINAKDILVVDGVQITLADLGDTYTVAVSVSGDGGSTFTPMGNLTVTTAGGTVATPKLVIGWVNGRIAVGDSVQVRLQNVTASVHWGFSDITPSIDVVGRRS